jgi:putative ABC transport system substrate-binding protein
MRRRDLIALLGGAAVLRPPATAAQQTERMRRVGVLSPFPERDAIFQSWLTAFVQALAHLGWVEGKNIRIDYRFAVGNPAFFPIYAAELVGLSPDAILASTISPVAALRQKTRTIPIVFVLMPDPVGLGFVQSLARPGGNITGFSSFDPPLMGKWLELLKDIAPGVTRVAVIFSPETSGGPYASLFNRVIETAGLSAGVTVTPARVRDDAEIEKAIADQARQPGGGLITLPDAFVAAHRGVVIAVAARHDLPLMGMAEIFPRDGALMSYGFDPADQYAQAASYIDRILKGAKPADLPVQRPTKFKLIINMKTAKALGLTVPPMLLAQADEIIQ